MLVTYFVSFFLIFVPVALIQKYLFHSDSETILMSAVFAAGAAVIVAMENHLKNIKMIVKNAFRKKIK